ATELQRQRLVLCRHRMAPLQAPIDDMEMSSVEARDSSQASARQPSASSAALPAYFACLPSCCSMRSNWLYLAVRSERASEPVLIWPQLVATARSAMVECSVSPERCDITEV